MKPRHVKSFSELCGKRFQLKKPIPIYSGSSKRRAPESIKAGRVLVVLEIGSRYKGIYKDRISPKNILAHVEWRIDTDRKIYNEDDWVWLEDLQNIELAELVTVKEVVQKRVAAAIVRDIVPGSRSLALSRR